MSMLFLDKDRAAGRQEGRGALLASLSPLADMGLGYDGSSSSGGSRRSSMVVPSARLMPYILDTGWIAVPRFQAPQVAHADVSALGQALLGEIFCPAHGAQLFAVDNRSPFLPLFHPAFRGAGICRRAPARLPACGRRRISLAHKKASISPWDRKRQKF